MAKLLKCRRSLISIFAITCLTILGLYHGTDISGIAVAIAGVAGSLSGSNAWENRSSKKRETEDDAPSAKSSPKADSPD